MQLLEEFEISGCFFFESCSEIPKCLAVQWQCSVFLTKILKKLVFFLTWSFFSQDTFPTGFFRLGRLWFVAAQSGCSTFNIHLEYSFLGTPKSCRIFIY